MKNIIFLVCDQLQRKAVSDEDKAVVPNLRGLEADSVTFPRAHSVNAICSPARASIITGVLPHNHGMVDCTHTVPSYRADFNTSLLTLPQKLKSLGYHTCYYGKWHIERSYRLEDFGIDEYETEKDLPANRLTTVKKISVSQPGYRDYSIAGVYAEGEEVSEEHYVYHRAIDFISRHKDGPFCAFISTYAPHDPYMVPASVYELYEGRDIRCPESWDEDYSSKPNIYNRLHDVWKALSPEQVADAIRCYYASCTLVDMQIRRLVSYLKENGLYDDTLIIFTSDHGDMVGAHGMFCKGVTPYEDVYNIPLLMKLPGNTGAGRCCDVLADTCDILPTVLDIIGAEWDGGRLDGESLLPYMAGRKSCDDKVSLAEFYGQRYSYTQRILWSGRLKYVFNAFDDDEFYDLEEDPDEMMNLIRDPEHQDDVRRLASLMWKRVKDTGDWSFRDAQYCMHRILPEGPDDSDVNPAFSMFNKTL